MNLFQYCDKEATIFLKRAANTDNEADFDRFHSLFGAFYRMASNVDLMSQEEFNDYIPF